MMLSGMNLWYNDPGVLLTLEKDFGGSTQTAPLASELESSTIHLHSKLFPFQMIYDLTGSLSTNFKKKLRQLQV
jgi:hypothetical protein